MSKSMQSVSRAIELFSAAELATFRQAIETSPASELTKFGWLFVGLKITLAALVTADAIVNGGAL